MTPKESGEKELLPCPFCGGKIKIIDDPIMADQEFFCCRKCSYELHFLTDTRQQAVVAWNTRTKEQLYDNE